MRAVTTLRIRRAETRIADRRQLRADQILLGQVAQRVLPPRDRQEVQQISVDNASKDTLQSHKPE
jgi:hypothetical protein